MTNKPRHMSIPGQSSMGVLLLSWRLSVGTASLLGYVTLPPCPCCQKVLETLSVNAETPRCYVGPYASVGKDIPLPPPPVHKETANEHLDSKKGPSDIQQGIAIIVTQCLDLINSPPLAPKVQPVPDHGPKR